MMIAENARRHCAGLAAAAMAALLAVPGPALAQQQKVLKAVMHADVRTLDPFWTTQTIAGIHGMLVYDTLFGNDDKQVPHPQMVEKYEVSPDRLTYTFLLRAGLKFHDGSPVLPKDVIASLKRWGARDGAGQRLMSYVTKMEGVDERTFRMVLKQPYGMVLETLGKTGTSVPVIMREQEALVDPQQQIKEAIGSGPFMFKKDEWAPGAKAVYVKNPNYLPRPGNEKASAFSGTKFAGVDRIELVWISDPQTAMSALINGEIDFYEQPSIDFLPILEKSRGVKLMKTGAFDSTAGFVRLNHLHPPFNNVKARQAMYHLINQEDFLRAIIGNPSYYTVCHGMFPCGTPYGAGSGNAMMKEYNPKKALQLLKEAGYKGEPITILATTDHVTIAPATQVLIQAMREAGINLDVQSMDWGSVVSRRAKKEPPAQGGWHIFITTMGTVSAANPVLHTWIGAACDKGLFGWPCDEKIEELRTKFAFAQSADERKKIAAELEARAIEQVVYVPFGQWTSPIAYRADRIDGIVPNTGLAVLWNIVKK
jgi:peptide/nickel transport system substrate-binding protein